MDAVNKAGNPAIAGLPKKMNHWQGQWWFLFAVMVANKPAEVTDRKLHMLLDPIKNRGLTPFECIDNMIERGELGDNLRRVASGQYTRIVKAFITAMSYPRHDPRKWSLKDLLDIPGVGPKTARWYYMLAHPEAKVAALDTHVLKFLGDQGHLVPKSTPPEGERYCKLEKIFLDYADRFGMTPRDLDFFVWATYRQGFRLVKKDG